MIVDIIMSNEWNALKQEMKVKTNQTFRMYICQNKILECQQSEGQVRIGKIHHSKNHDGHSNQMMFILTTNGFKIKVHCPGKQEFFLVPQGGRIDQG